MALLLVATVPSPARAAAHPAAPSPAMAGARAAARRHPPAAQAIEGVANLNRATPEELQILPGVGPAKVRQIVALRSARPFRSVDDLLEVKGIGPKLLARLRPHVSVDGPTTVRRVGAPASPAKAALGARPTATTAAPPPK
jgi:competence protein ComEA